MNSGKNSSLEPGSLHGGRPNIEPPADPDADIIAEARSLDAAAFKKRFKTGTPAEAELNAALARRGNKL